MVDLHRLERERAFHNARFTEETRTAQEKYYVAIADCERRFAEAVHAAAVDASVLEYGCATGEWAVGIAGVAREVRGIDISDVAVQAARQRAATAGRTNLGFDVGDAHATGYPDAAFDLVFGSGIIHHLDTRRALTEIARILRPGGRAIFKEPLGSNLAFNLYRRLTPGARTPDEHPLVGRDFAIAREIYSLVELSYFGLTSLATTPFHRMPRMRRTVFGVTTRLDRMLFQIPGVRDQAWYALAVLTK